jgi:hypothetical protein
MRDGHGITGPGRDTTTLLSASAEDMPDTPLANIESWTAGLSVPAYAIDDDTAITVVDGAVEVVSEGKWKLLTPSPEAS